MNGWVLGKISSRIGFEAAGQAFRQSDVLRALGEASDHDPALFSAKLHPPRIDGEATAP